MQLPTLPVELNILVGTQRTGQCYFLYPSVDPKCFLE